MTSPSKPTPDAVRYRDVAVAVGAGVAVAAGSWGAEGRLVPPLEPLDALGWALIALACAALAVRRRWPTVTFVIVAAAVVAYLFGRYPYGPIFFVLSYTMYGVAVRVSTTRGVLWCLAAYGAALGAVFAVEESMPSDDVVAYLGTWAFALVTPLLMGVIVRLRRRYAEQAFARRAYEERLVVAREVHDVVAHGLSVISMQSGGALHVFDTEPDKAKQALRAIRAASREALGELRSTLSELRQETGPAGTLGLGQLDDLVTRLASSGLTVTVHRTGDTTALPDAVDVAAYRIVREALTNVLRHAGTSDAVVRVEYQTDAIAVAVTDTGRGVPGPEGHGIAGMRERAARVGGDLTAGPRPDGGFAVRAVLPASFTEEGL